MKFKFSRYYFAAMLFLLGCSSSDKPVDPIAAARHRASDNMPIASRSRAGRELAQQQAANSAAGNNNIGVNVSDAEVASNSSANAATHAAAAAVPPPRRRTLAEY